ncbi:XRE family transcriptional regulator [bacterium]|nr:XRE family transcriptional regulator [bacterium]
MTASGKPPAVGQILADKRHQRGLSLQSLAKLSGVSKSMISQIENGQVNPTLAVVWKLASGLGLKLQDLLEGEMESRDSMFTLLGEANCPTLTSKEHGHKVQILSTVDWVEKAELYKIEFEPKGVMDSDPHSKGTIETLTVIRGEVAVKLGDRTNIVKALETARYHADVPHGIHAHGNKGALFMLAVNFQPPSKKSSNWE